jgi:Spy/CpxP family protein refolding chaperone
MMRFIKHIAITACLPFVFLVSSRLLAIDEPIPDFGLEGPAGTDRAYFKEESPKFEQKRDYAKSRLQGMQALRGLLQRLDLSTEQQLKIRILLESSAKEGTQVREEISRLQDTIKASRSISGNEFATKQTKSQLLALTKQSLELQSTTLESLKEVLTPDQAEKFNQLQAQMRQRASRGNKT